MAEKILKKLPLDLSTFRELRESNYVYVDKTEYAYNLITGGRRFFLSRPRRFGKSLLVSTLQEILLGNKELFKDLWIKKSDYAWKPHAVITLDFSALGIEDAESCEKGIFYALQRIASEYGITEPLETMSPELALNSLVNSLHKRFKAVAILIDEYDNPILHALKDTENAQKIRDVFHRIFSTMKSLDAKINFIFITGVSSFAKAGIFSGMNNLQIITLTEKFAAICGYTDEEVDHYFSEHIQAWADKEHKTYAQLRSEIKDWYNGYRFGNNFPSVYNPFSFMKALAGQEFENFWFQSGAPTFLIEVLKKQHHVFDHEKLELSKDSLGIFDVGVTPLISLMFQAGYLTITGYDPETQLYKLNYPNREVSVSLQKYLLEVFAGLDSIDAQNMSLKFRAALNNERIEEAITYLKQLFVHVPHQLYSKEEKYYHVILQMICIGAGIKTQSEYSTANGSIDLVIDLPKILYVVEVKFNLSAEKALEQILERRYWEPFLKYGKPITLIGLSFERKPGKFDITYVSKKL